MTRIAPLFLALTLAVGVQAGAEEEAVQYGDWSGRCAQGDQGRVCNISQHLSLKESGEPLLRITIGRIPDQAQPVALLAVPLGVYLPDGVDIRVDEGKPKNYTYDYCDNSGCWLAYPLDQALLRAYKRGRYAKVSFANRQRDKITVPVSLKGFTKGIASLDAAGDE